MKKTLQTVESIEVTPEYLEELRTKNQTMWIELTTTHRTFDISTPYDPSFLMVEQKVTDGKILTKPGRH